MPTIESQEKGPYRVALGGDKIEVTLGHDLPAEAVRFFVSVAGDAATDPPLRAMFRDAERAEWGREYFQKVGKDVVWIQDATAE